MAKLSSHFRNAVLWAAFAATAVTAVTWGTVWYYSRTSFDKPIPVKNLTATLSSAEPLILHVGEEKITLKSSTVKNWIEPYTRSYSGEKDLRISDRLTDYLQTLSRQSGTPARDVRFTVSGGKITILAQAQAGTMLDVPVADQAVRQALLSGVNDVDLPVISVPPTITEEMISSLNITDKIATGESNFSGSTPARIQNISTAAALYNGLLIPAGQTFSFNTVLGEVDAEHGYAPEKVIKSGKIEYEYGGGICQVSTTVFRAAMGAGMQIVERKNHAFPVHYYEPQGYDATIYPGVSDLRFVNDTPSYVLVQTKISGKNLYVDFYGTSDGRIVTIDGPHQFDIQPDGAMKAYITKTVSFPDGASKSQTFRSSYKSPSLYPTEPNPYL